MWWIAKNKGLADLARKPLSGAPGMGAIYRVKVPKLAWCRASLPPCR